MSERPYDDGSFYPEQSCFLLLVLGRPTEKDKTGSKQQGGDEEGRTPKVSSSLPSLSSGHFRDSSRCSTLTDSVARYQI